MHGSGSTPGNWTTYENVSPYIGLLIISVLVLIILRARWLAKKDPSTEWLTKTSKAIKIKRIRKNKF